MACGSMIALRSGIASVVIARPTFLAGQVARFYSSALFGSLWRNEYSPEQLRLLEKLASRFNSLSSF
jgi:hypothetical protein